MSRLMRVNREICSRYENYNLGEAAKGLYEFAWNDLCDWYVELIKRRLMLSSNPSESLIADQQIARQVLSKVLTELLVMLHPLMPHLTEELWHGITGYSDKCLLALQPWPHLEQTYIDDDLEQSFKELIEVIRIIRNLRALSGLKASQCIPVRLVTGRKYLIDVFNDASSDIKALARANELEILDPASASEKPVKKALAGVSGDLQVLLLIEGFVDLDALKSRLEKDFAKAEKDIADLSARLGNTSFVEKAPEAIVLESKRKLQEAQMQADLTRKRLSDLA